jgi:hypothetical protein
LHQPTANTIAAAIRPQCAAAEEAAVPKVSQPKMIRFGKQIRLTKKEVERFAELTGFEPMNVKTLEDLDAYIARCKRHYWGVSKDTQFLHWLIDQERSRCVQGK